MKFLYYFSPFYRGKILATYYHEDESPGLLMKAIMRMHIIFFLILITCLNVFSKEATAQISLHIERGDLESVFKAIEKQTDYSFMYEVSLLKGSRVVSIDVRNAKLEDVLNEVFRDQPIAYQIVAKTITLKARENKAILQPQSLDFAIKGKVTDKQSSPLEGVSVRIKGTSAGTLTDQKGNYTITADPNDVIVFSYVGYQTFEVKINRQTRIDMTMVENEVQLNETVIKGYYNTTKEFNTGNVSTVKADQISRQPVGDPMAALVGLVPGLFVQQTSGVAGRKFNIQLRGRNSLDNGNNPLFIVDNIPFESNPFNVDQVQFPAGGMASPFNYLNPSDIESITVLKDADATAIYGSRGANGVVLITTKKGKAGKTQLDFNHYSGFSLMDQRVQFMNTKEYMDMRRRAFANDNRSPGSRDYDLNGTYDTTRDTNWQDVLFGGSAPLSETSINLSGGNELTSFRIGATYRSEDVVYPGNFNSRKFATSLSLNHKSQDQKFNTALSTTFSNTENRLPGSGITQGIDYAIALAPNAPMIYNADGTFNWANNRWKNPIAPFDATSNEEGKNLIASLSAEYKIYTGLALKAVLSYNLADYNQRNLTPRSAQNPNFFPINTHEFLTNKRESWNFEPQLSYVKSYSDLAIDVLLGTTFHGTTTTLFGMRGTGFASDAILDNFAAAGTTLSLANSFSKYRYNAIYTRIGLTFHNKYVINGTARRDGSSRFGPGRRFGNFGAIGIAWLFSNENLFNTSKWLSFGKLRGSFGATGNDQLGEYKYLDTYSIIPGTYQGINGLIPTQLTNPFYGWERVDKYEVGLELGFNNNRVLLTTSLYRNRTKNQLVQYALPAVSGFTSVRENLPAVIQNSGLELEATTHNVESKYFSWSTSANITFPKNKLVSYPNLEASSYANWFRVGQPLSLAFVYNYLGADPGSKLYNFQDVDGDGNLTSLDLIPQFVGQKFYGSITNNLKYKGFDLSFSFQFTKQNGFNYYFNNAPGFYSSGQGNEIIQKGKTVYLPPLSQSNFDYFMTISNFKQSNGIIDDASFIRLRNVSIAWKIPVMSKLKEVINKASIYFQGQNLLTLTDYSGFDPETPSSGPLLPPLRTYTIGLRASF